MIKIFKYSSLIFAAFLFLGLLSCTQKMFYQASNPELSKQIKLRFAVASDGHYKGNSKAAETNYQNIVNWLNKEKTNKGLDFIFFLGDLTTNNGSYLPVIRDKYLNHENLGTPFYVIKGNHDYAAKEEWQSIWGYDSNFSFAKDDYAFILADTSISGNYRAFVCADHEWLSRQLEKYSEKKNVFVLMHIAPMIIKDKIYAPEFLQIDCPPTTSAIESHSNIRAVFSGHLHLLTQCQEINGTNYCWNGSFGGGNNMGLSARVYRVVEVYEDGDIYTYIYDPINDRILSSNYLEKTNRIYAADNGSHQEKSFLQNIY